MQSSAEKFKGAVSWRRTARYGSIASPSDRSRFWLSTEMTADVFDKLRNREHEAEPCAEGGDSQHETELRTPSKIEESDCIKDIVCRDHTSNGERMKMWRRSRAHGSDTPLHRRQLTNFTPRGSSLASSPC